jgi:hypothetical protein
VRRGPGGGSENKIERSALTRELGVLFQRVAEELVEGRDKPPGDRSFGDVGPLPVGGWLRHLARLQADKTAIEDQIEEAIAVARRDGISWTKIGEALGVSRQAARDRFGPGGRRDVTRPRFGSLDERRPSAETPVAD